MLIAARFLHLCACFTCSSVHVSTLHPLLAHHHLCYVDVYYVFYGSDYGYTCPDKRVSLSFKHCGSHGV